MVPAPASTPRRSKARSQRCWQRWPAPVGGQDEHPPHRPGRLLPRVPHPAAPAARSQRRYVYTDPSKQALAAVKVAVPTLTTTMRNQLLRVLLHRLNWVLGGWTTYCRHGSSSATFDYLRAFAYGGGCAGSAASTAQQLEAAAPPRPARMVADAGEVQMFNPAAVRIVRHRYRGAKTPTPWTGGTQGSPACAHRHGLVESPLRGNAHGGFGGAGRRNRPPRTHDTALRPDPTTTIHAAGGPTCAGVGSPRGSPAAGSSPASGWGVIAGRSSARWPGCWPTGA
jgi:hypothetical protein